MVLDEDAVRRTDAALASRLARNSARGQHGAVEEGQWQSGQRDMQCATLAESSAIPGITVGAVCGRIKRATPGHEPEASSTSSRESPPIEEELERRGFQSRLCGSKGIPCMT